MPVHRRDEPILSLGTVGRGLRPENARLSPMERRATRSNIWSTHFPSRVT